MYRKQSILSKLFCLFIFLSVFTTIIVNANPKDPIEKAIVDSKHETLCKMIFHCPSIKKNRDAHISLAQETLSKRQANLQKTFDSSDAWRILTGLTSLGLGFTGFLAAKELPETLCEHPRRASAMCVAFGSICTLHGCAQVSKGFTKYDRMQQYYKALAIKEMLQNNI